MIRLCLACLALATVACGGSGRELAPIRLDPIGTIGDTAGAMAFRSAARVSDLHPAGFRVVIPQLGGMQALPARFDAQGRHLNDLGSWGRRAEGFDRPLFARFGPGDSIWIFDANRRVLIFDTEGQYVRSFTLSANPWDAVILPDGSVLVSTASSGDSVALRHLDPEGRLRRAFRAGNRVDPGLRQLIPGRDGRIWAVLMQRQWRVEQWDTAGAFVRAIDRSPEWYPVYQQYRGPQLDAAPLPTLVDGWEDEAGRLWIMGKMADPNWRDGLLPGGIGDGAPAVIIADPDRLYDTMLEVIDPATGAVLAATRLDPSFTMVLEPGVIGRMVARGQGVQQVELMRASLDTVGRR